METEELNPWITVSKKKGIRPSLSNDAGSQASRADIEPQTNSFVNLRIDVSGAESLDANAHRPPTPSEPSPPRKRSKKEPKKVCSYNKLSDRSLIILRSRSTTTRSISKLD